MNATIEKLQTRVGKIQTWKPAGKAILRARHRRLVLSFLILVVVPFLAASFYLFVIAHDQYASRVGFSVRKQEMSAAVELLGGISKLGGGGSDDSDVLYEYLKSDNIVLAVGKRVDLAKTFDNPGDPLFSLGSDERIESIAKFWRRMVKVSYNGSSGLLDITVRAFRPEDAETLARAILDESSAMINNLSTAAQEEATRFARNELDVAIERLKEARAALTEFRASKQMVDPSADIQGRMGLINTLQAQLADALIELDLLRQNAADSDPRIEKAKLKAKVIRDRIEAERNQFGSAKDEDPSAFPDLVNQYESLSVDLQFAEKAYLTALASYDASVAEAQRKSRYLATFVEPTLAQTSEYPRRGVILGTITGFALLVWSIMAMLYYSLRDRR